MLRRFYTVMVVPHEGGDLTKLSVSLRFVITLTAVFLLSFVSSAFLGHQFLQGWNKVDKSEQFRVAAERTSLENAHVHSSLYRTVVALDSLTARLDALGPARRTARVAAVIGREFREDLLALVAGRDAIDLQADLRALVDATLVHRRRRARATYVFKHALVRDAAYGALTAPDRAAVHGRIGEALEGGFPSEVERRPELLATMWTLCVCDLVGPFPLAIREFSRFRL